MAKFDNPLDNVRVATPCKADWEGMYGDDRRRFCGECRMNVYNLSGMSRREAEQLLIESEGRLCVRFFRRPDGTVLTSDCPVGWRAATQRVSKAAVAVFSMITGLFAGMLSVGAYQKAADFVSTQADLNAVGEVVPEYGYDIAPVQMEPPGWIVGRSMMGAYLKTDIDTHEPKTIYPKYLEREGDLRAE